MDGVFPLAPSFDHAGPMARDVAGCVELMAALVPGLAVEPIELGEGRSASHGPSRRSRWCERASKRRPVLFPDWRALAFPEPVGTSPAFMRDVAGVHRELFEEHSELYGENPRRKIERCLAVTDAEAEAATLARREYERLAAEASRAWTCS